MIGQSIKIKGEITGSEDLVIRGTVEGTIDLSDYEATIGESGKVKADIKGKTVVINGEVTGDIAGGEKVIISKTGRVRGNIVSPRVMLEDGAVFKGSIDMDPGEPVTRSSTSAAASEPRPANSAASSTSNSSNASGSSRQDQKTG